MKNHPKVRDFIFVQINQNEHYALTSGVYFSEFIHTFSQEIQNMLLIRHQFADGHFNLKTKFDYVDQENKEKLFADDVYNYTDFCWLDFEEEEHLNLLSNKDIAELLFLGHMKTHLQLPFYSPLSNRFAYISYEDGFLNKVYYRNWIDFYRVLGTSLHLKVNQQMSKSLLGRWTKKTVPNIEARVLERFLSYMKEGLVFSLEKTNRTRNLIEIPVWIMNESSDMNSIYEEYDQLQNNTPDGKLICNRKSGEWEAVLNE